MRTTFKTNNNHTLVSAQRPKGEPHEVKVGWCLVLTRDYHTEYGPIKAGAKGFVELVDEDDGTLWVLMEGIEPALLYWDNYLVLSPYNCEDILVSIRLPIDSRCRVVA